MNSISDMTAGTIKVLTADRVEPMVSRLPSKRDLTLVIPDFGIMNYW